jgi:Co/Zn/Cd efflux system component
MKLIPSSQTPQATYGFARFEIVGALVNGVFLLATSFTICLEALQVWLARPL